VIGPAVIACDKRAAFAQGSVSDKTVITGLVPVIHVLLPDPGDKDVDGRVKPGHDGRGVSDGLRKWLNPSYGS
jgi:hypothetical protein